MAWMKTFLFVALINVVTATASLAQTDQEVYAEVDRIFAEAEESVADNLETYIKANEQPLTKAREGMSELIAEINKDGRSQLATALQSKLNGLEDTIQKRASQKVPIIARQRKPMVEKLVDLFPLVDLSCDSMRGTWSRVGTEFECNPGGPAELLLRYEPLAEYDFKCEFTSNGRPDCVSLACYANGKRFVCDFGGWGNEVIGFNVVDGMDGNSHPSSVRSRPVLVPGKRHTVMVKVRRNEVSAWLDGQKRVVLTTNFKNLDYRNDTVIPPKMLGIVAWNQQVRFHSAVVENLIPDGQKSRP